MQNQPLSPVFFPQSKKAAFLNKSGQEFSLFVQVQRRLGIIARMALIFSRRGFDIQAFQYLPTHDEGQASMHVSFRGNQEQLRGIMNEIKKLPDVVQVNLLR